METLIYKIVCKDYDKQYEFIGLSKTIKSIKQRMKTKLNTKKYNKNDNKLYTYIEENKGIDNFNFIIIDKVILTTNNNKKAILQEYLNKYKPELNKLG